MNFEVFFMKSSQKPKTQYNTHKGLSLGVGNGDLNLHSRLDADGRLRGGGVKKETQSSKSKTEKYKLMKVERLYCIQHIYTGTRRRIQSA